MKITTHYFNAPFKCAINENQKENKALQIQKHLFGGTMDKVEPCFSEHRF